MVSGMGLPGGDKSPANVTKPGFEGPAGDGVGLLTPLGALTLVIVPPLPVNEVSID